MSCNNTAATVTISRPIMINNNCTNTHRTNPSCESINWAYPTQYRPRGPNQSVPSAAHAPSASISSTISSSLHCRTRSDFSTVEGTSEMINNNNNNNSRYPNRIDSRRALLSMANGIKAPLLLRGPSHNGKRARVPPGGGRTKNPADVPALPSIPKRTSTVQYLHKELPPTPPSSSSTSSSGTSTSITGANHQVSPERKAVLPSTKPLNLAIHPNNTLAAKRLSRSRGKLAGGGLALSRFRAVPAPIQPPPPFRGTAAFNGPSSASTTDDEFAGDADIEELQLGEPLIVPGLQKQVQVHHVNEQKVVMTPMGELPITPLDIPVDWDDLHDRWTSPVAVHHEDEAAAASALGQAFVFDAFRQDINDLFARSPSIEVRGSIEAGFSPERENAYAIKRSRTMDLNPFSYAADLDLSEADSEGSDTKREKRHGKVLVKKELKLCLDMNVDFGENNKTRRRRSNSSKVGGPKAGESFLMISPLSPDSAVTASILC